MARHNQVLTLDSFRISQNTGESFVITISALFISLFHSSNYQMLVVGTFIIGLCLCAQLFDGQIFE
jgi:hypothetical protein